MAVITKGGTPVLGLDIGAAFIKAVEMRPSRGALAITGVGVLPTPPGCIVNDEIVDPVVLASAVKQLLAENGIKTKDTICSVAGQSSVVVRVIEVPRMTEKELAETMRWEIDRHIPFSPDEVVKDYSPIVKPGDDPHSANMAVLLAVAQNNVVAGMLQTVLAAGLTPVAIDVESLAGARALFDVDDAYPGQTVALVNIGSTKTDVGIYESGTLAFPRTIPVAGNAMTEAVAQKLGVEVADAERLKKQHGFVPADAAERFGSQAAATAEDQFEFGDFGGAGLDFTSSGAGFGAPAPEAPSFGAPEFGAPAGGAFGGGAFGQPETGGTGAPGTPGTEPTVGPGGFAETTEGPVFGAPSFPGNAFGTPESTQPAPTGPTFGAPEPPGAGPAAAAPEDPTFGAPTFEAPAFEAPSVGGGYAAPGPAGAAEGPTFDLPDMGPANNGPVAQPEGDIPSAYGDTPPVTSPGEVTALTPDEAPVQPASVPEVVTEAERHRREISDAFMPVVAELATEIKRSLEYYSTRANNARVDRVVVFGGVASLPGLNRFLETELGVPVQSATLPGAVSLGSKGLTGDYLQQVAPLLPVALGLAARDAIAGEPVASKKAA